MKYCKRFERDADFTTVTRTAHEHKMGHMAKIGRPKWWEREQFLENDHFETKSSKSEILQTVREGRQL